MYIIQFHKLVNYIAFLFYDSHCRMQSKIYISIFRESECAVTPLTGLPK